MFKLYTNPNFFNNSPAIHLKPAVDVIENEKNYQILVNLPGIEKENISLDFKNNVLSIKTENKNKTESRYLIKERNVQNFERFFELPSDTDINNIQAKLNNGVLTIDIPKKQTESIKIM